MKKIVGVFALTLAFLFTSVATSAWAQDEAQAERGPAAAAVEKRTLSEEDQRILERGEIDQSRYITGGVIGSIFGFGIGHAIQGRYPEKGWIFTVTEGVSIAIYTAGLVTYVRDELDNSRDNSRGGGLVVAGLLGYLGFHIWEIIDLWVTPPSLNERYHELRHQGAGRTGSNWHVFPTVVGEAKAPGFGFAATF